MKQVDVPIWEKFALTIEEAAAYFNIGETTLRELISDSTNVGLVMYVGKKKLIKRSSFEAWLNKQYILK